jgi:NADH:quinone reductase (non-electrogenic)
MIRAAREAGLAAARTRGRRKRQDVVVLGGGFAGVAALRSLPPRFRVTLVDERDAFEFLPNIHELISGLKTPELLRLPLAPLARRARARFVHARVEEIDPERRRVVLTDGRSLPYDALIFALGGVNAAHGVAGVERFAWPFKSVDQVARIAARLDELAGEAGEPQPVVVVGGGLEGVEALGEILRRDPEGKAFLPTLIEAGPRLLPGAPAGVARSIARHAEQRGVVVRTGVPVSALGAEQVVLASGARLPSRCTIWTGGPAPSPVLAASGLAAPGRWCDASETLAHPLHPEIFVCGDAAELPKPLPRQGYHALDMGSQAARNAARWLAGAKPEPFRAQEKPALIAFGDLDTYLVWGRFALASPLLAGTKEAVYELLMARLDDRPPVPRARDAVRRLLEAGRGLVWPGLISPAALLRAGRFEVLGSR